jgi:ribonucleoside-diphosphate reductase alpha subunit
MAATETKEVKESSYVITRSGKKEPVSLDKIIERIRGLSEGLDVDPVKVTEKVMNELKGGVSGLTTTRLDELSAKAADSLLYLHPDYSRLGGRITVSNLHKQTKPTFVEAMKECYNLEILAPDCFKFILRHEREIEQAICTEQDFTYDFFSIQTLIHQNYLWRNPITSNVIERPQYMLMRVACGIFYPRTIVVDQKEQGPSYSEEELFRETLNTYHALSKRRISLATPILFNSGRRRIAQLASCYLLTVADDSIDGIMETLKRCALISKGAGGIGVSFSGVRANGSRIRGTEGKSNGIIPFLRVYNQTAACVDQGGGKRKGSFVIYLEPWHADIIQFLELRDNRPPEELRTRGLFLALWIPDLLMERAMKDQDWTLFCPDEAPGLVDLYDDRITGERKFSLKYEEYERKNLGRKVMKARKLLEFIIPKMTETGLPYMLFKDACNTRSNQKNLGTIRGSNLCAEIVQFTSRDEVAVCNLGSLPLSSFLTPNAKRHFKRHCWTSAGHPYLSFYLFQCLETCNISFPQPVQELLRDYIDYFDYPELGRSSKLLVRILNRVIDVNMYPIPEAEKSNRAHRPLGIGIQGQDDCMKTLRYLWDSKEAEFFNESMMETINFSAVEQSHQLALRFGSYSSFKGSPASQGLLQQDLWELERLNYWKKSPADAKAKTTGWYNWDQLRSDIKTKQALRNSLLIAPMPTGTTSQITGSSESFEPRQTNLYKRHTLSGEYCQLDQFLVQDLIHLALWNLEMFHALLANNGSIQPIQPLSSSSSSSSLSEMEAVKCLEKIPPEVRKLYRTIWELPPATTLRHAAQRMPWIDQSQSFNNHHGDATTEKILRYLFTAWRECVKTASYYCHVKLLSRAIKFAVSGAVTTIKADPSSNVSSASEEFLKLLALQQEEEAKNPLEACENCSS